MKTDFLRRLGTAWLLTVAVGTTLMVGCGDAQPEVVPARPGATPERYARHARESEAAPEANEQSHGRTPSLPAGVPAKAAKVLGHVDKYQRPPEGYEGGRPFGNHEGLLPQRDAHGRPIRYQEWDVNPKTPGKNRGPERLVTGSDSTAYYTPDHYRSFIKIR